MEPARTFRPFTSRLRDRPCATGEEVDTASNPILRLQARWRIAGPGTRDRAALGLLGS